MLYIFTLIICFILLVWYDLLGKTKYKLNWYNTLLLWFIIVSGFQFQVGVDIPLYMDEYANFNVSDFEFIDLFTGEEDRRQPGWILLIYLCRLINANFFVFKLISAIFLNVSIFSFFKRESNNIFICIFLYALLGYLVLNFNIMRQAYALGFALYGYSYLKRDNYIKYLLCLFGAFMFHNSAFLMLLPLLYKFLKYKKFYLYITIFIALIFVYIMSTIDFTELLINIFMSDSIDTNVATVGMNYMQNERLGVTDKVAIFSLARLFYVTVIIYYLIKTKDIQLSYMGFTYLAISIVASGFPIIWRFRIYFDMSFIMILAYFIKNINTHFRHIKGIITIVFISITIYLSTRDYLGYYPNSKFRYIDQYYPYHSIFNPIVEYDRLNYFNNY